jgi:hypothetical protein
MPDRRRGLARRLCGAAASLLLAGVSGCTQLPPVAAVAIPPVAPSQARIWVYRDLQTSVIPARPYVRFNGAIEGTADQGSAFYRDVPAGHYHITVDSIGTDIGQASDVDLAPGQQAYIKILQLDNWDESPYEPTFPTFYARLMWPQVAVAEVGSSWFTGTGNPTAAPR